MTTLTVADFADTGQWRLIVNIYTTGMEAFLENTLHDDIEPQLLFSTKWENDPATLLNHIENAVYDNPRVLDDFSASIVLFDRRTLFIPTELIDEEDGHDSADPVDIYTALYTSEPTDVLVETDGDLTAASSMAPGLKGFLKRTFPGARISSNLMNQLRTLRKNEAPGAEAKPKRMVVTERDDEADFILLDGKRLISASTHAVTAPEDITYHAYNIINTYGLSLSEVSFPPLYNPPAVG